MKKILLLLIILIGLIPAQANVLDSLSIHSSVAPESSTEGIIRFSFVLKKSCSISYKLLDNEGKEAVVGSSKTKMKAGRDTMSIPVEKVNKWSAETPNLYTLVLTTNEKPNQEEVRAKIGFRSVGIANNSFLFNGSPILLNGINLHQEIEHENTNNLGQTICFIKSFDINAVRTSRLDDTWLSLCDSLGIYVCAELSDALSLSQLQEINTHPCVILWSVGKDIANDSHLQSLYDYIDGSDIPGIVMIEGLSSDDMRSKIYAPINPSPKAVDEFCTGIRPGALRPLILPEYSLSGPIAHGAIDEYSMNARKYQKFAGGFLSEGTLRDMKNSPSTAEAIRYAYQSISVKSVAPRVGHLWVLNDSYFRTLDDVQIIWKVRNNGSVVLQGTYDGLHETPQGNGQWVKLGYEDLYKTFPQGELTLDLDFILSNSRPAISKGSIIATKEIVIRSFDEKDSIKIADKENGNALRVDKRDGVTIGNNGFMLHFNRINGFIDRYTVKGHNMLRPGTIVCPNFWRIPTENDRKAKVNSLLGKWNNPTFKLQKVYVQKTLMREAKVCTSYLVLPAKINLSINYSVSVGGDVRIDMKVQGPQEAFYQAVPCYGMSFCLSAEMSKFEYFGRGPHNNYTDRKFSQPVGLWKGELAIGNHLHKGAYKNINRCDVRWWRQLTSSGHGLLIASPRLFAFSINPINNRVVVDRQQSGIGEFTYIGKYSETLSDYRARLVPDTFTFWLMPF